MADTSGQRIYLALRMALNLKNTGHPFHHMTADGTIVDTDPTLQQAMLRLGPDDRPPIPPYDPAGVLPTVPINRMFYGFDPAAETAPINQPQAGDLDESSLTRFDQFRVQEAHEREEEEARERGIPRRPNAADDE
jgi:hypothetical protein